MGKDFLTAWALPFLSVTKVPLKRRGRNDWDKQAKVLGEVVEVPIGSVTHGYDSVLIVNSHFAFQSIRGAPMGVMQIYGLGITILRFQVRAVRYASMTWEHIVRCLLRELHGQAPALSLGLDSSNVKYISHGTP